MRAKKSPLRRAVPAREAAEREWQAFRAPRGAGLSG